MPDIQHLLDKYRINTSADQLLRRWEEPHRAYHGKAHLYDLFRQIADDYDKGNITATEREKLELVALFHDIIYDRTDNEERSTQLLLSLCDNPKDADILAIHEAILATANHEDVSPLSATFNRYDMNIVERSFDELLDWEHGIYQEYKSIGDEAYKTGRLRFLQSLPGKYPDNRVNLEKLIAWVASNY
ncbi:MAG TPA: hypothetical protein VIN07_14185 [Flavipsychrobacter sp.]